MQPLNIKLYADGSSLEELVELNKKPEIQGFTYNPTLVRKLKANDYREFCKDVLSCVKVKPVSLEVISDDFDEMEKQALEIASWAENVYVKIPVMNTKGQPSYDLISKLSHFGVKVNVTAIFTINQIIKVSKALSEGVLSICSIFAGRIMDAGQNPENIMRSAVSICETVSPNTEVLWASPRASIDAITAQNCGCHIITMTPDLIKKLPLFGKDLTEFSRETVVMFYNDAVKSEYTL